MDSVELPGWAVGSGVALLSMAIGLVGWLLKRAISGLDGRFDMLAGQLKQLGERLDLKASQTGEHAVSLGIVRAELEALEKRVERLESAA